MNEHQTKLDELVQPVARAIRGAGFSFPYHFGGSILHYRVTAFGQAEHKDVPHWKGSLCVTMSLSTLKIDKVTIKSEGMRTITCRKLEPAKIISTFNQGVEITKQRYKEAELSHQADQIFSAHREKDFEGWDIPPFLEYGFFSDVKRKEYRLWNLRSNAQHTTGLYNIFGQNLDPVLKNLTAAQVKDLCNYLQNVLPKIK